MTDRDMNPPIVWIDLETTGLCDRGNVILEIACVITDGNLEELDSAVEAVYCAGPASLEMDDGVREMHTGSGLLRECSNIDHAVFLDTAEDVVLDLMRAHCAPGASPMAGSSPAFDRRFIRTHMPRLDRELHYRNLDVSTLIELAERWCPEFVDAMPPRKKAHRAMSDIRESIGVARYFRPIFVAA